VWQFAQCDTTSIAPGGGIVTLPTEAREEPAAGVCQAVATAVRHVSNFAGETYCGTIDARPIIIIWAVSASASAAGKNGPAEQLR
jgi:hypothetical protein